MTTPDHSLPQGSEITTLPAEAPALSQPANQAASTPLPRPSALLLFDWILLGVALVFAFLAASFAARNSDFWMHLASGRLLAEGRYSFGVDPFAFTTEGVYWANHAWLFDLLLFLLYTKLGGAVVVVLKALLIALLAGFMLSVRRPGSRLGMPVFCTLLAVLAMSPRLLLHSTCLSFVFLGAALWLLWRGREGASLKRYAPLLLLFVLWVNVDDWFLLGPALAALFWLGDLLRPERDADGTIRRTPAWLWLAGLAVCLLNPHSWHPFALPVELSPLPPALKQDIRFEPLHATPWQMHLLYQPSSGVNLAMAAYFALLALGLVSFALNGREWSGWRLFVWLGFAAVSAWVARTIPFFAVVAAPIAALNWQDYLGRRGAASRGEGILRGTSRGVVLVVGLALIALTWPGWLQSVHDSGRYLDWSVQPDPSLQRVAETLRDWRKQGKLREGRGFLAHPSIAHYCAWICPEEKGFVDHRLPLFAAVAGDYEQVCRVLNPGLDSARSEQPNEWRAILRKHGITHLVLYDPNLARQPALKQLAEANEERPLLEIDGRTLILGWKDGEQRLPQDVPVFDAERLAFGSAPGAEAERMTPPAPPRGPLRDPRVAGWWARFSNPAAPSSWETDSAGVMLRYFLDRLPHEQQTRVRRCLAWAISLHGLPALSSGSMDGALRFAGAMGQMPYAPFDPGQQSPALALLAVRLARRALAENPNDATAYHVLARAYSVLRDLTVERIVLGPMQPLSQLRHIQIAVALENVVRLQPSNAAAHDDLANHYQRRQFFDAALEHRRTALELTRRDGPARGESAESFSTRLKQMEESTRLLELSVGELKNEFTLHTQQMSSEPYRKAKLALGRGLAHLALDEILQNAPMVLLGGDGTRLQLELSLQLGQAEQVRERLQSSDWQANKTNLGFVELPVPSPTGLGTPFRLPAYDWLLFCQSAALGDYDQADAAVRALIRALDEQQPVPNLRGLRPKMAMLLTMELGAAAGWLPNLPRSLIHDHLAFLVEPINNLSYALVEQADLQVLSGMLSLERGRPGEAEQAFRKSLEMSDLASTSVRPSTGRPLAEVYRRIIASAK